MHTFRTRKTTFQHNSDFSGDVFIVVPKNKITPTGLDNGRVAVPFTDLLDFVLSYVQGEIIDKVQNMSRHDVLTLLGLALKIDSEDSPIQDHQSGR